MNILAVFRSRTHTLSFTSELKKHGVSAQTVPAPKQAGIGCGLACRFPAAALPRARNLVSGGRFSSFAGFYRTYSDGNGVLPL